MEGRCSGDAVYKQGLGVCYTPLPVSEAYNCRIQGSSVASGLQVASVMIFMLPIGNLACLGYPNVRAGFVNALHRLCVSMSRSRDDPVRRAINMEEGQCAATRFEAGQSVYAFLGLRL